MATNQAVITSAQDDKNYKTLLGLADFFRTSQPPRLRELIHCLQATLSIETLPSLQKARCRLNLAKLLLQHTRNVGHARGQLEQAVSNTRFNCVYGEHNSQVLDLIACNAELQPLLSLIPRPTKHDSFGEYNKINIFTSVSWRFQ